MATPAEANGKRMHICPICGSKWLRRSRSRGLERLLKIFTRKRPHRCYACGWRGWGFDARH